ncbi:MAG: T9SS type A sorting domain-containing protein, partial [Bacteroidota bacterium]
KTILDLCRDTFIDRLVLVNAETNQDIMPLEDRSVIPFSQFGQTPLSIRAETDSSLVQSVTLRLKGPKRHFQRENVQPFSLFGDNGPEDYRGEILPSGNYELFVQAFSEKKAQGMSGKQLRIRFSVEAENPQIGRLELFEPDERTGTFRTVLNDGDRINIENLTDGFPFFTIQAFTDPGQIGSVHFSLQGPIHQEQTENQLPYVIFGDTKNTDFNSNREFDFNSQRLRPGAYTLRVTPYSLPNRQGIVGESLEINFEVFDPSQNIMVFPNPAADQIHVDSPSGGILSIFNAFGEIIYQQAYAQAIHDDIKFNQAQKGIYLIRLQNENGVQELKLIRE